MLCRTPVVTDAQARKLRLWPQQLAAQLPCSHIAILSTRVLEKAATNLPLPTTATMNAHGNFPSFGTVPKSRSFGASAATPYLDVSAAATQSTALPRQQQQVHSSLGGGSVDGGEQLMTRAASAVCRALWLRATMLRKHLEPSLPNADGSFWKTVDQILVR